jgi:hypothetical protein
MWDPSLTTEPLSRNKRTPAFGPGSSCFVLGGARLRVVRQLSPADQRKCNETSTAFPIMHPLSRRVCHLCDTWSVMLAIQGPVPFLAEGIPVHNP